VVDAVAGYSVHRGCLALGIRPDSSFRLASDGDRSRLIVGLERLADPANVGAVLRTAAVLGVDAALLGPGCADPYSRRAIRASAGAVLSFDVAQSADWLGDLDRLARGGVRLAALTPAPSAEVITRAALAGGQSGLALLLGAEGEGLSAETLARAHVCIRIPLAAPADSLNVAAAAAIAIFVVRAQQHDRPRPARFADVGPTG
jgi:tRNA G18 (ribose-2'-O)-methylase SpoU